MTDKPRVPLETAREIRRLVRTNKVDEVEEFFASSIYTIDDFDTGGDSLLYQAIELRHEAMAMWLLDHGADIHFVSGSGYSAFALAATCNERVALRMLEEGAEMNVRTNEWEGIPLLNAAAIGYTKLVDALLEKQVDTKMSNKYHQNLFAVAARNGQHELIDHLTANHHMSVDSTNANNYTALEAVLEKQDGYNCTALVTLLARGADLDATGTNGEALRTHLGQWLSSISSAFLEEKHAGLLAKRLLAAVPTTECPLDQLTTGNLIGTAAEAGALDQPRSWMQLAEMSEAFAAKGQRITKSLLHTENPPIGNDYFEYGLKCVGFKNLHQQLAKAGVHLTVEDLVTKEGKATPWLEAIVSERQVGMFCESSFLVSQKDGALMRLQNALPDAYRHKFPAHRLILTRKNEEVQERVPGRA